MFSHVFTVQVSESVVATEPSSQLLLNISGLQASSDVPIPPHYGGRDEVTERHKEREHSRPEQANAACLGSAIFRP